MPRICSQCQQSSSMQDFVCSHCGVEFVDNGELLSALNLSDSSTKQPIPIIPIIGALIVIIVAGFLAKLLSS